MRYLNGPKAEGSRYVIGRGALVELAKVGKLPHLYIGGRYVFSQEALGRWLESLGSEST